MHTSSETGRDEELTCLPLASILKKLMLRRNVHRVFQSYFASKITKGACWPRKAKDSCPIRPKKIRTRASLRTFTIQTATKLLYGGNNMSLIDGIGGAFLFSNNPKGLAEWYRENLGISCEESPDYSSIYTTFSHRDLNDASVKRTTAWGILRSDSDIAGKPRTGKINYRVKS